MGTYVIGGVIGSPYGENINREPIRPPNVLIFRLAIQSETTRERKDVKSNITKGKGENLTNIFYLYSPYSIWGGIKPTPTQRTSFQAPCRPQQLIVFHINCRKLLCDACRLMCRSLGGLVAPLLARCFWPEA